MPDKLSQVEMDTIDTIIKDALIDLCVTAFGIRVELAESDELDKVEGYSIGADIVVQYRNLHATITLYPVVIEYFRKDPYTIIPVLYHEVAHIVTNRFKDLVWPLLNLDERYESVCRDAHEYTTEMLKRLALAYRQSYDPSYRRENYAKAEEKEAEVSGQSPDPTGEETI